MIMLTDDRISINIYFDSQNREKRVRDFSLHYRAKIDDRWESVLRVDTATHGNRKLKGGAHAHHFYKKTKTWIQPLGDDLDDIFESWFRDILRRSKHIKSKFLHNK